MVDVPVSVTNTQGRRRDAILAAVVNPDGSTVGGSSFIEPRPVPPLSIGQSYAILMDIVRVNAS